ncbi:MAG: YwaF family protein [Saccharofermentans sp.]|nr:YwaF family protein [Saccharofermentans sp.]
MSFWEIFWAYKTILTEHGIEGFSIFSLTHIVWLVILTASIIVYGLTYKRGDEKRRDNLRKGAAVFLILFEILKLSEIALTDVPVKNFVPLEICSFAEYAIHQFLFHGAIVAYIAARCAAGDINRRYSGLWLTVLTIVITLFPVYCLDKTFGTNHMFLTYHSNNPALKMIWNLTGGEGGIPYVIGLAGFVVLVMHIWYAGWLIADLISKKKKNRGLLWTINCRNQWKAQLN